MMLRLRWKSKTKLPAAMLILAAALAFSSTFAFQATSAPSWRLEVSGFGSVREFPLLVSDDGQPYIEVGLLADAFKIGLNKQAGSATFTWGGRSVALTEGSASFADRTLPSKVKKIDGRLCFPAKGLASFGVKVTIDEPKAMITATVPRASIVSMSRVSSDGPTVLSVQLTFAPSKIDSFILSSPDRLVIDLSETVVDPAQSRDIVSAEALKLRASMNKPGVARVVVELTKAGAGSRVYQDASDPSLIRISFPGRVLSAGLVEIAGLPAFELKASSPPVGHSIESTEEGKAVLTLSDFIVDKAFKLAGEGYTAQQLQWPAVAFSLSPGQLLLGKPYVKGNTLIVPLKNAILGLRTAEGGAKGVTVDFSAPLLSYRQIIGPESEIQGALLSNVEPVLPLEEEGERGIPPVILEGIESGAKLIFAEAGLKVRGIVLSEDAMSLSFLMGGTISGVEQYIDNGVIRLSFKYQGGTESPIFSGQEDDFTLTFPGVTGIAEAVRSPMLIEGAGELAWTVGEVGVECRLRLVEPLTAVVRPYKNDGTVSVDIGKKVTSYGVESLNGTSRITIMTSGTASPSIFRLREPDRLVVDLPGFVEGTGTDQEVGSGSVRKFRSGQNTIGVARIVFDLDRYLGHTWSVSDDGLTISIILADKLTGLSGRLILIDPGHGGTDGGAVGNALKEKDVNLDICLRLRAMLEAQGAVVVMTRSQDSKVDLLDRSSLANLILPDAIVCVHSNSVISEAPNGTETYYFSAEELSRELASAVHKSLVDRIKLTNRGVFKKEYHMVKETLSPSVLVEVGFLSNKADAAMLSDSAFRQRAAEGIFDGLASYFGGTVHESWAAMKEDLLRAMLAPAPSGPKFAWPGLQVEEPWTIVLPSAKDLQIEQVTGSTSDDGKSEEDI